MPVIGIPLEPLRGMLGRAVEGDELLRILERIGCDVEGYARLKRSRCLRCGWVEERTETEEPPARCDRCDEDHRSQPDSIEPMSDLEVVRMELLAVRPDMFDPGGLARALRGYLGIETGWPEYPTEASDLVVRVDPSVRDPRSRRPHIACAALDGVRLDGDRVKILMKLQENLHWALGRNRKLASIGVYDMAGLASEFVYTTEDPDAYSFVPLGWTGRTPCSLRTILDEHPKGKGYRHLLDGLARYPILRDGAGRVLSMPPIINSDDTKVRTESTRLFIDVTGLGERVVQRTLNILVTSLAENLPGSRILRVAVEGASDRTGEGARETPMETPDLSPQPATLHVGAAARLIGIDLDAPAAVTLLEKMRHRAVAEDADRVRVEIPAYRNDILHERDLMEDLAIAYGYHRIEPKLLPARTVGRPMEVETQTERVREALCGLGFLEVTTLVLLNDETHDQMLGCGIDVRAARIDNPISGDQTRLRTRLLPGLLQVLKHNLHEPLPQRIFEVGDVTWLDPRSETGATEHRMLAFAVISPKAGYTDARAVAESVVREFGAVAAWEPAGEPPFLRGRCARVLLPGGKAVGVIGEVAPEVLERFGFQNPIALGEIGIDAVAGRPPRTRFSLDS